MMGEMRNPSSVFPRGRVAAIMLYLAIALPLFIWGATLQGRYVNTKPSRTDQGSYLQEAQSWAAARSQGESFVTERNRMPVYLWLLSHVVTPEMKEREAFKVGKRFSIWVAAVCFAAVTVLGFSIFTPLAGILFATLSGFLLLMFRAPLVQCEVLFYTLFLISAVRMIQLLRAPSVAGAVVVGVLSALTYLTKASMLPAVAGFSILLAARCIRSFVVDRGSFRHSVSVLLGYILTFLVLLAPYLLENKSRFGRYFYNVNSTFYIWYSSWDEAKAGTRAHGDRLSWPDLPDDQLPSAQRYLETYGVQGVLERFQRGFGTIWQRLWQAYGFMPFFMGLGGVLIVVLIWKRTEVGKYRAAHGEVIVGATGALIGYFLLAVWYQPIVEGPRIVLTVFMPLLAAILYTLEKLLQASPRDRKIRQWIFGGCIVWLVVDLITVFDSRIVQVYGGF